MDRVKLLQLNKSEEYMKEIDKFCSSHVIKNKILTTNYFYDQMKSVGTSEFQHFSNNISF